MKRAALSYEWQRRSSSGGWAFWSDVGELAPGSWPASWVGRSWVLFESLDWRLVARLDAV